MRSFHSRLKTRKQSGFTLIELFIVIALIGIIFLIIGGILFIVVGGRGAKYAKSHTVQDVDVVSFLEEQGYEEPVIVKPWRVKYEDLGCLAGDSAGYEARSGHINLTVCCIGSPGALPKCRIIEPK